MQCPTEYNYEIMTSEQYQKYVKDSFSNESQPQSQPQPQPQPQLPQDTFGQIKLTNVQSMQPNHIPQLIRPACLGAYGPSQSNEIFSNTMINMKKDKEKKETIDSLYAELSSIRLQIELLTKTTDNIYRIITKL